MSRGAGRDASEQIIAVVLTLLQTEGYDSVQLREVARRARVSLATVYKLFSTRDELIVTAIEHWMADNAYPDLAPPTAEESLHDGLMRVLRSVFEPWERSPKMLEAFHRARSGPGGTRLDTQGIEAILPIAGQIFGGADQEYIEDVGLILVNMAYALVGRVADGTLRADEMLPILDRVLRRLTSNNETAAAEARDLRVIQDPARPFRLDPTVIAAFDRKTQRASDAG